MGKIRRIRDGERVHKVYDHLIVSTAFSPDELGSSALISESDERIRESVKLISGYAKNLKNGGLLFVYGLPQVLPFLAKYLNGSEDDGHRYLFKYWIALESRKGGKKSVLGNRHLGLLMYLKTKSLRFPEPFKLNTKEVRIPYVSCSACGRHLKDWGGKRHMMNPLGTAYSDIWSGAIENLRDAGEIPESVTNIIDSLASGGNAEILLVRQTKVFGQPERKAKARKGSRIRPEDRNRVVLGDSVKLMQEIKEKYPKGVLTLPLPTRPTTCQRTTAGMTMPEETWSI